MDTKLTNKTGRFSKIRILDFVVLFCAVFAFIKVTVEMKNISLNAEKELKVQSEYNMLKTLVFSSYDDIEKMQQDVNYKNACNQFDKGEIAVKSTLDDVNNLSTNENKLKIIRGLQNSYNEMPGVLIIDKKDNVVISNESEVLRKIGRNYFPIIESENQKKLSKSGTDEELALLYFSRQLDSQKIAVLDTVGVVGNFYTRQLKLDNHNYKVILFKERNKNSTLLIYKSQMMIEVFLIVVVLLIELFILAKLIYNFIQFKPIGVIKQLREDFFVDKAIYILSLYKELYKYSKRYVVIFNINIVMIILLSILECVIYRSDINGRRFSLGIVGVSLILAIVILIFNIIIINVETAIDDIESGNFDRFKKRTGFGYKRIYSKLRNINEGYDKALNESIKSERLKTELITNVSHDLKTPLTSIINYVNILKTRNITEEERKEYLDILDRKTNRLKNLIFDLFEVSKLSSGKISLHKSQIDLLELLNQCIGESSTLYDEKHLEVKVTSKFEKLPMDIDGEKMSRVFENLIINAYKYSMENTRIYIDIYEENSRIVISFKNIACYEMNFTSDEVFERFVRGDKARTSKIEGSGLGMAITKSIVELHGGKMKVDIEGDMFKVYIYLNKN